MRDESTVPERTWCFWDFASLEGWGEISVYMSQTFVINSELVVVTEVWMKFPFPSLVSDYGRSQRWIIKVNPVLKSSRGSCLFSLAHSLSETVLSNLNKRGCGVGFSHSFVLECILRPLFIFTEAHVPEICNVLFLDLHNSKPQHWCLSKVISTCNNVCAKMQFQLILFSIQTDGYSSLWAQWRFRDLFNIPHSLSVNDFCTGATNPSISELACGLSVIKSADSVKKKITLL